SQLLFRGGSGVSNFQEVDRSAFRHDNKCRFEIPGRKIPKLKGSLCNVMSRIGGIGFKCIHLLDKQSLPCGEIDIVATVWVVASQTFKKGVHPRGVVHGRQHDRFNGIAISPESRFWEKALIDEVNHLDWIELEDF